MRCKWDLPEYSVDAVYHFPRTMICMAEGIKQEADMFRNESDGFEVNRVASASSTTPNFVKVGVQHVGRPGVRDPVTPFSSLS